VEVTATQASQFQNWKFAGIECTV